jgi:signal transduction histidine kinase
VYTEIPKEWLSAHELVASAISEYRIALQREEMTVEDNIPKDLMLYANPVIIETLKNFINNAIGHASDGKRIVIDASEDQDFTMLSVTDFGKTIPEKDRINIFTRSFQLSRSDTRGQGLGLAIVQRLAIAHGGKAWVEANTPCGNRFCISIPNAPAAGTQPLSE